MHSNKPSVRHRRSVFHAHADHDERGEVEEGRKRLQQVPLLLLDRGQARIAGVEVVEGQRVRRGAPVAHRAKDKAHSLRGCNGDRSIVFRRRRSERRAARRERSEHIRAEHGQRWHSTLRNQTC